MKPDEKSLLGTSEQPDMPEHLPGPIAAEDYPTVSLKKLIAKAGGDATLVLPDVKNDYELDNALIGQTVKHNGCIIQTPWTDTELTIRYWNDPNSESHSSTRTVKGQVRPIAAYLVYIRKDSIPKGVQESYSLRKLKGFSRKSTKSNEITAGVSVGILGCEASLEVTTGFSFEDGINEESEETWTRTVTGPQDYWTFQPCLVYAHKLPHPRHVYPDYLENQRWTYSYRQEFGSLYFDYTSKTGHNVFGFSLVFRNSPSTMDRDIGYLSLEDLISYLCNEGWGRW